MDVDELIKRLEEFKKQGKYVDVRVCPRCKSASLQRVGSIEGDASGHMAMTLPKYKCLDCGWRGRLTIYATNRPLTSKQISTATKALEQDDDTSNSGN